jgi:predicted amidohydrolase
VEIKNEELFNTYICVDKTGLKAKFSKIHPFISKYFSPGNEYVVFDIKGWKCGILICYDNNVIENVRATSLLGAQIIFAPHVTMCTPSSMPGRGFVSDELWQKRETDPVPLRMEFDGPKGRQWLITWLPARAYDNGVYYVFSNPIGYDGDQLKNGNSMIIDPYGNIMTEIKSFKDEIATATVTEDKLTLAGGYRYTNARKPELYKDILSADHHSETKPAWMDKKDA